MEPENPIEETLKASARKRRAEFGLNPSMPNPMRARLHEEISAMGRSEEAPRFRFAWPRLALATAAAALLIGVPVLWQLRNSRRSATISAARETNMPATAETATAEEKSRAGSQEVADAAASTDHVAAAAPAMAKTAGITQQFAQIATQQELAKSNAVNVLSNFRLEQNGESVRMIDADGSTYTGRMEPLALTDARALANQKLDYAARAKAPSTTRKKEKESTNEYYIHASGYNAQLKKPLSFEGNYIADASSANEMQDKDEKSAKQARIVGTARIEGEPPVQVEATAVSP
jgi:hypothetical protein